MSYEFFSFGKPRMIYDATFFYLSLITHHLSLYNINIIPVAGGVGHAGNWYFFVIICA